jgi:hypothetical protein
VVLRGETFLQIHKKRVEEISEWKLKFKVSTGPAFDLLLQGISGVLEDFSHESKTEMPLG